MRCVRRCVLLALLTFGPRLALHAQDQSPPACDEEPVPLELRDGDRVLLIGNTLIERDRYYGQFETMLRTRFAGVAFTVRNMAWPGDTVTVQLRPLNFGSMAEHVSAYDPTVVFVSYGTNEAFEGPPGLEAFVAGYESMLDMLAANGARIVVVSPIRHENLGPPLPAPAEHNRELEQYVAAIGELAERRGYPFVDLFHGLPHEEGGSPPAYPLTDNGMHLTDYGYWVAAGTMGEALWPELDEWRVEVSATDGAVEAAGAEVSDVEACGGAVAFTVRDAVLPAALPSDAPPGAAGAFGRVLVLRGLAAGRYGLRIDGEDVASASAAEWAVGVPLTAGAEFDQSRALREAIVVKDRLFFDRWRAHNGEYIYGRRAAAGDGNAGNPTFPAEFAELDRLLEEADARIVELSAPVSRRYELTRE